MNKNVRASFSSCLRMVGYVIPLQLGVFTENVVMAGSLSIMVPKLNQRRSIIITRSLGRTYFVFPAIYFL